MLSAEADAWPAYGMTGRPAGRRSMRIWKQALDLARRTPAGRNRYVDFLRALAIGVVVVGHWLAAAPFVAGARLEIVRMLGVAPWLHGLTWALQVMPVFFVVGGYANAASWEAAERDGRGYGPWLHGRLTRLMAPVLPLLLFWAALCVIAGWAGVAPELLRNASRLALIPTWFIAVYVIVILLVPVTYAAWRRYGLASFWLPVSAAILVDALAFGHGLAALRWVNYAFVWVAVHQLGYLWRSGRVDEPAVAAGWLFAGLSCLVFLIEVANYPVAMLTVPGAEFSNTRPPTVALVALAAMQFGIIAVVQAPARRWLERSAPWAATILVNGSIMTIFLWHSTVQVLVIGLAWALGGIGLTWTPGSGLWWATRPFWIGALFLALVPVVALLGRFEHGARRPGSTGLAPAAQVAGALTACLGVALLAGGGMSAASAPWLRVWPLSCALAGVTAVLARPARRRAERQH